MCCKLVFICNVYYIYILYKLINTGIDFVFNCVQLLSGTYFSEAKRIKNNDAILVNIHAYLKALKITELSNLKQVYKLK